MENTIKNASLIASQFDDLTESLSRAEADMASGDLYSWTYGTMRQFKQQYKIEIPDIGPPHTGDVDLFPTFPYKQLSFTISGKAYYHDLGKFVADFENQFPHARLANLTITPVGSPSEQEFRFFRGYRRTRENPERFVNLMKDHKQKSTGGPILLLLHPGSNTRGGDSNQNASRSSDAKTCGGHQSQRRLLLCRLPFSTSRTSPKVRTRPHSSRFRCAPMHRRWFPRQKPRI